MADAEAKVEKYRSSTNLFIGTNNTSLSNQQLGESNAQLGTARAQKSDAEAKARLIREALKSAYSIEYLRHHQLRTDAAAVRSSGSRCAPSSPSSPRRCSTSIRASKSCARKSATSKRQMRSEADRLARSLENDAKLASDKVDGISAALDQLKVQAASTNEQDVQLRALEREAKSQRDLLESYLAKYREATARDSVGAVSPDARIISTAVVSNTPSWPRSCRPCWSRRWRCLRSPPGFVLTQRTARRVAGP